MPAERSAIRDGQAIREETMDVVLLMGRVLFVAVFIVSGATVHLLKWRDGVAYARMRNIPAPELLVPASGVMAVVGGLLVATGLWADLGALLLAAFVFPVAIGMHPFWRFTDPMERLQEQVHFMKDIALGGAALALFALFQQFGDEIGLTLGPTALFS
jgi:putative oxidoreductase